MIGNIYTSGLVIIFFRSKRQLVIISLIGDISWMPYLQSLSYQMAQRVKKDLNMKELLAQTRKIEKTLGKIKKYQHRLLA